MKIIYWLLALAALVVGGCGRPSAGGGDSVTIDGVVRATTAPVGWMARTISGGLVPVETLCPPDLAPDTWRPGPDVVELYQRAAVIATNGAGFERWVRNAPLPRSRVVRSADAIEGGFVRVLGETHSHGPRGDHAHEIIDGHTWLDPLNAIAQAGAIERAMASAFPEHAAGFSANLEGLESEMRAIHERLGRVGASGVAVLAPERPYGYLARRYGWSAVRLGGDPGSWHGELGAMDLAAVLDGRDYAVVLCETPLDDGLAAELLASFGVLAVQWETGELEGVRSYAGVLSENADRLEAALADASP